MKGIKQTERRYKSGDAHSMNIVCVCTLHTNTYAHLTLKHTHTRTHINKHTHAKTLQTLAHRIKIFSFIQALN